MLFTVVVGMLLSTRGELPPWWTLIFGSLGIALVAGAAAAINHLVDRRIDAIMARTRGRPLPRVFSGRLAKGEKTRSTLGNPEENKQQSVVIFAVRF